MYFVKNMAVHQVFFGAIYLGSNNDVIEFDNEELYSIVTNILSKMSIIDFPNPKSFISEMYFYQD